MDEDEQPKRKSKNGIWWKDQPYYHAQAVTPCDEVWNDLDRQQLIREWLERGEPKRMMFPVEMDGMRYAMFALGVIEIESKRVRVIVDPLTNRVYTGKEI